MKPSEKATLISKTNDYLSYLREEYNRCVLWGSDPDGDVKFEQLIDWLSKDQNSYNMDHLIKVIRDMEKI